MLKRVLSIGAYALCVRAYQLLRACRLYSCRALEPLCCCPRVLESSSLRGFGGFKASVLLVGESASPFIVEGDDLTSQRERKISYGRCVVLLPTSSGMGWLLASIILFMFLRIWQALPCWPNMPRWHCPIDA